MENKEEINLYDYWLVIKKNFRFIIILFIVTVLISMVVSFSMPKIYRVFVLTQKSTTALT